MIDALVSIFVLGLGVLGVLGIQIATLKETQNSVRRAQAVRVIEDLSERFKSNPHGFAILNSNSLSLPSSFDELPSTPERDCRQSGCNPVELAKWDLWHWRSNIPSMIQNGKALVFKLQGDGGNVNRRQFAVMVAWPLTERSVHTQAQSASGSQQRDAQNLYTQPFAMDLTQQGGGVCPQGHICHVAYLQP